MKRKLNDFLDSIKDFDLATNADKILFLIYFYTAILKKSDISTNDLEKVCVLADLPIPQNFGGEIKKLLNSQTITKTRLGYRLRISGLKKVQSKINVVNIKKKIIKNDSWSYINPGRLKELKSARSSKYDLTRLIKLCEELNAAFQNDSYLSIPMLVRAILDHIPPIFVLKTFTEVANNYGTKSFRDSMLHLDNSSRKIADAFLHTQIRAKEVLPNSTQVDFSNDLDVLLGEIYRILK